VLLGGTVGFALTLGFSAIVRATLALPGTPDLLFGVDPFDPQTFAFLYALMAAVALIAMYVPARRAMSVDPLVAIRDE
jgi:ABC-type antimicrobial peptide transport system permease subunit